MKEAYVSYEVAKLLKEKWFDWEVRSLYGNYQQDLGFSSWSNNYNAYDDLYSAPTQQMACRWLREEKGIFVDIRVYSGLPVQFGYDISVLYPDKTLVDKGGTFGFSSYEEATEKGIKYVLQNLSKYL